MSQRKIVPTEDELRILRDKLNAIADIPHKDSIVNNSQNSTKIIAQLTQQINELQNTLAQNSHKIAKYDSLYQENAELKEQLMNINNKLNNSANSKHSPDINEEYFGGEPVKEGDNFPTKNNPQNNPNHRSTNAPIINSIQINSEGQNIQSLLEQIAKLKQENMLLEQRIKELTKKAADREKDNQLNEYLKKSNDLNPTNDYLKQAFLELLHRDKVNKLNQENDVSLELSPDDKTGNITNLFNQFFPKNKKDTNLISFLLDRINSLEYQNFTLLSKIEYFINVIIQTSDELIEYIDVICDIRNVLNSIPNENPKLNDDFFIIRDTLNKKEYILSQQKELILDRKSQIERNDIKSKNLNVLLCGDKITETKLSNMRNQGNPQNNAKMIEILNEKISEFESIKDMMSKYEDFMIYLQHENEDEEIEFRWKAKEELNMCNSYLREKNARYKEIILDLITSKGTITDEELEKMAKEINEINVNSEIFEDMVELMKISGMMIENAMKKGVYN